MVIAAQVVESEALQMHLVCGSGQGLCLFEERNGFFVVRSVQFGHCDLVAGEDKLGSLLNNKH
jgi:hypothetical protein